MSRWNTTIKTRSASRNRKAILNVATSASAGIEPLPAKRIFNLVPGFECLPVTISMDAGEEIRIRLKASVL